jgi:hypothetical protein
MTQNDLTLPERLDGCAKAASIVRTLGNVSGLALTVDAGNVEMVSDDFFEEFLRHLFQSKRVYGVYFNNIDPSHIFKIKNAARNLKVSNKIGVSIVKNEE